MLLKVFGLVDPPPEKLLIDWSGKGV